MGERLPGRVAGQFVGGRGGHPVQLAAQGPGDVGGEHHIGQVVERGVGGQHLGHGDVEHGVEAPGDQLADQRVLVEEGAAGGVDQGGAVAHQGEPAAVDQMVGRREFGRVHADRVGGGAELVQPDQARAEPGGLGLVHVRVVEQQVEVVGAQQFEHAAPDPGGADDADGAPVVARVGVAALPVVRGAAAAAVVLADPQELLVGEQDGGDGVLGDGQGVGPGGGGDPQAALPAGVGDVVLDGPRRVDDGAKLRGGGEDVPVDRGAAPAGDDDLGPGEGGPGLLGAEVVEHQGGVEFGELGEAGQGVGVEEPSGEVAVHGEYGAGAAARGCRVGRSGVGHGLLRDDGGGVGADRGRVT